MLKFKLINRTPFFLNPFTPTVLYGMFQTKKITVPFYLLRVDMDNPKTVTYNTKFDANLKLEHKWM